jgi:hypothetical protein
MAKSTYLVIFVVANPLQNRNDFISKILEIDFAVVPPIQLAKVMTDNPSATAAKKVQLLKEIAKTEFLDKTVTFMAAAGMDPAKTSLQSIIKIC